MPALHPTTCPTPVATPNAAYPGTPTAQPGHHTRRPGLRHLLAHGVQRGFTLVELMIVVVIIGVLGALIVPNLMDRPNEARVTAARTDIASIMQALKLYKLDNHRYPTTQQGLAALVTLPASGPAPAHWKPYLDKLPNDPWGQPYQYLNPGLHGEIDVLSFGADGQSGGEGFDADIGSWQ